MLFVYFSRMWHLPHYQYFPFAIAAVVWLAWTRSDRNFYPPARIGSLLGVCLGSIALLAAWTLKSPWMMTVAFVFFACGCLNAMRGKRDASLLAVGLPLLLLVRLPLGMDQILVLKLQQLTTVLSSLMLDVIGVAHAITGNVIQLPGRELFVAEACSGIQSVFTLAFLSTLIVVIYRRRLWLVPLYLIVASLLAVAGNVIRVTTVAVAESWYHFDLASGWMHDALGYLTLGLAAMLLVSFDNLIFSVLHPISQSMAGASSNPLVQFWNWCVDDGSTIDVADSYYEVAKPKKRFDTERAEFRSWMETWQNTPALTAIATLGLTLTIVSVVKASQVRPTGVEAGAGLFADGLIWDPSPEWIAQAESSYPITFHQVARNGEDPRLGRNADVFNFSHVQADSDDIAGQFVISQSYHEWHELCLCYQSSEWRLLDREVERLAEDPDVATNTPFALAIFSNENGHRGYLWFSAIAENGAIVTPPPSPGRLGGRLDDAFNSDESEGKRVMMVQLWMPVLDRLDAEVTRKVSQDFVGLRELARQSVQSLKPRTSLTSASEEN